MPNPRFLLFLSLLAIAVASTSAVYGRGGMVGGYSPIKNLNDDNLVDIAKFAVTEYNKEKGDNLRFIKIVKGDSQVVSGTNYRLVIEAKKAATVRHYEAIVYDRPWSSFRNLTSFNPL